ncbi:dihydrodipicolinate synthase family protein [Sanguibacter antarcticus]|uniref:4-hydroxy-tetrahydrodipicolinate synthase n=1 Tax=Sanguibacter antarcticus TaxID=372484 RepID=A0A2A9E3C5_9MICO|nr:dihydrodipicolinate synthase family protein [Sanguibacter antarcticus]PFG33334.1 4-hydroxy-tetrahydrodipicolinate synthase [Sanguibacter antarcticus]
MPSIGPLVAYPLTPRGEDGRLLTGSFERLVDAAITAGASAVGVLGSTGGFAYMPRSARKRITRSAVEVAAGRVPVIVGVGALSTAEVVANLAEAHAAGASGALLQPMAYQPLQPDEIYGLYRDAAASSDIPLWVYNNPGTTGHRFGVDELARLARLSGVAGFKDRGANGPDVKDRIEKITAELPQRTANRLDWGFSGDGLGAQILLAGASAWHSSIAGVLPDICVAITRAATSGQAAEARTLQLQLTPLAIIVRQYGGIRVAHAIAEILGLAPGALPKPLLPLPVDARMLVQITVEAIKVPKPPAPKRERTQATRPTSEDETRATAAEESAAAGRHSG